MNNKKRWKDLSDHCPIIADFGETSEKKVNEIQKELNEMVEEIKGVI
jgi:hypothetical protein